ncbi:hypothetical protein Q5P01_012244 [Channa striata]|uniref:Uncharacterized protein n=1 Tax=Channa striata TaxID=64152 RepID=A0AA88MRD4_CHASR|nr:hypothetical protein Q5P01_012244 [Channa striata]
MAATRHMSEVVTWNLTLFSRDFYGVVWSAHTGSHNLTRNNPALRQKVQGKQDSVFGAIRRQCCQTRLGAAQGAHCSQCNSQIQLFEIGSSVWSPLLAPLRKKPTA